MILLASACSVSVTCNVLASEDPSTVMRALESVLDGVDASCDNGTAHATSETPASLIKIRQIVQSRATSRTWRRRFRLNTEGNSTWVYLNKQAAAFGVIALCSESDESPLGPITLRIHSEDIQEVIDWLVPYSQALAQQN